jgi:hypothetical protein
MINFIRASFPFIDIYPKKINSRFIKGENRIFFGVIFLMIALVILLFGYSIFGDSLFESPDPEGLFILFFKDILFPVFFLFVAWFVMSLKTHEDRMEEIRFLTSLPIPYKKICVHMILTVMIRFCWFPGGLWFLFLVLAPDSPKSFLIRLDAILFLLFCLVLINNITWHLFWATPQKRTHHVDYPSRFHPLIQTLSIFIFLLILITLIIFPGLLSGYPFFIVFFILIAGNSMALFWAMKTFQRWKESNSGYISKRSRKMRYRLTYIELFNKMSKWYPLKNMNPFLIKNILHSLRMKTNAANSLLTLILILIFYLISMNNKTIEDSIHVLMGLFLIYVVIFSVRSIQNFGEEIESIRSIYSLPVTRQQFYLSHFLPLFLWLFGVLGILCLLSLISGGSVNQIGLFWLKSIFSIIIFLTIAINCGIAHYPHSKEAQSRFFYFLLALVLFATIFFKYIITVALSVFVVSFIPVRKIRMFSYK